jgi:hypothetical protein
MLIAKIIKTLFRSPANGTERVADSSRHLYISNKWHAVSIALCPRACGAARKYVGVRFLSKDAPVLPLPDCRAPRCTCRFRHHEDRRSSLRRAADIIASGAYWAGQERRRSQGRRVND